jgi:hypothetical protein
MQTNFKIGKRHKRQVFAAKQEGKKKKKEKKEEGGKTYCINS